MHLTRKTSAAKVASASGARCKVLIVDDHPLTRLGMARMIELEPDLAVCGEADSPATALAAMQSLKPRVVLADLSMPGGEGLEMIKDITTRHPDATVLVVSMHDEIIYAERALRAGAQGYLMKTEAPRKLIEAIRRVLQGRIYLSEKMAGRILDVFSGRSVNNSVMGKLTDREFEVFNLLGQGLTTREIGRHLRVSAKTVETHRLHIREKLQISTGPALIQHAVRWAGAQKLI